MLRRAVRLALAAMVCAFAGGTALAIQPATDARPFRLHEGFSWPDYEAQPSLVIYEAGRADVPEDMARFLGEQGGRWDVRWDSRNERPHLVQGSGVPLLPGRGNRLTRAQVGLDALQPVGIEDVERLVRAFMARYPEMFRIAPEKLRLDRANSRSYGAGDRLWVVELQQYQEGVPVEGANVFFRINHGNIVQFGCDRIADVGIGARPALAAADARQRALDTLGVDAAEVAKVLDAGTLKIYPVLGEGERSGEPYEGLGGFGYTHLLVWEASFRLRGDVGTYRVAVDAQTGDLLRAWDLNAYATVQGGIYPTTNTDAEVLRPFGFTTVTNNGTKNTDAAGVYNYTAGTATATLNGQFFQMSDACGAISLSNSTTGNVNFGTSGGTDCTTPGVGGAGNTHASRTGFYHLTNINRRANSFLPGNTWLNNKVTANMNINQTCNAFWNGSTLNFYRSGGGCSNTGELAAVFLHEWGHGMDTNTGGAASEQGSGEAVGDTFAFTRTRDGCIGQNFLPGLNCENCTACTGVRDVADFSTAGGATGTKVASPVNVAANNGINCDRFACPYLSQGIFPYQGPMGYEGHCESYIASSANWDLAQSLVGVLGTEPGWAQMERIWYGSLTPSKSGYRVASGGTCNPAAVVDGCGATNWYTVYLPADDDDGNLANGTPNACRIWDAFNAHGVACGARPACSGGGGPTPTPTSTHTPTPTPPPGPTATPTSIPPTPTPTPPGTRFCRTPNVAIPDNNAAGVTDTLVVGAGGVLTDLNLQLTINHTWVGDLFATLRHVDTNRSIAVLDRPGVPATSFGCGGNNVVATLDDEALLPVEGVCSITVPTINGTYRPNNALSFFDGESVAGTWTLKVVDAAGSDTGTFVSWCLVPTTGTALTPTSMRTPTPTPTSPPPAPPPSPGPTPPPGPTATSTSTPMPPPPTPPSITVLQNGVPVTGISGASGSERYFSLAVPSGASNLSFAMSGGTGDADLYVRFGSLPTTSLYDCRPYTSTNNETCNWATPAAGTWYVMVRGYAAYAGVTLKGSFSGGPAPTPTSTSTATPLPPTPTPTPSGTELIVNGGFEGSASPWDLTAPPAVVWNASGTPHSGSAYVEMGIVNNVTGTSGVMFQTVTIPASAAGQLSFWLYVTSAETTTITQYDKLFVEVRSMSGTLLTTVATFSNLNKGFAYDLKSFGLSAFKGQTVRIQFRVTTDSSLTTSFRVDDVSLH